MSRLEYYNRPLVAFDPANKDHRAYFHQFLLTKAWGRCPVRFICPDEHGPGGVVDVIQRQLIEYYSRKEFGNEVVARRVRSVANLPRILVNQNGQKVVDTALV